MEFCEAAAARAAAFFGAGLDGGGVTNFAALLLLKGQ